MSDFVQQQWSQYKERIKQSAEYLAAGKDDLLKQFNDEVESILNQSEPTTYTELLKQMAEGTELVVQWQDRSPRELSSDPSNNPYADESNESS